MLTIKRIKNFRKNKFGIEPTKPGFRNETNQLITKACAAQSVRTDASIAANNKTKGKAAGMAKAKEKNANQKK